MSTQPSQAAGPTVDIRVGDGRYRLLYKINSGTFGTLYGGEDVLNKTPVAVKLEERAAVSHPQLEFEALVYRHLCPKKGIPSIKWDGMMDDYYAMVLELKGPSLEDCFNHCNRRFSVPTVLKLAIQMISLIEYIHGKNILHRDLKPDNFLIGAEKDDPDQIYIIDFGLSKRFRDNEGTHMPLHTDKTLTGTARYASVRSHKGIEQSRRDDLESIGYILIYFLRGSLPWQGISAPTKEEKYRMIGEIKETVDVEELTEGFPVCFREYLGQVKRLQFNEDPNYGLLGNIFQSALNEDARFDWNDGQ
eukprot:m.5909 g.5909  ORF g.5909 m.5909 type:complete len:304 (-) comp3435_c0_seq1:137-1048(-)